MALVKRGAYRYGDGQADIRTELVRYSAHAYPMGHSADAVCRCGGRVFRLLVDEGTAAVRACPTCGHEHAIGDGADYLYGFGLFAARNPRVRRWRLRTSTGTGPRTQQTESVLEGAHLEECECPCGGSSFELTVGVALYAESEAVKWVYLGCRCPGCGLTACYGDWKNEHDDYRHYLKQV